MTSPAVLDSDRSAIGLSGEQLYAAGPVSVDEPRVEQEPTALKRNVEITGETKPYRLSFESQASLPTISINSQAPTTSQAVALANAAAVGMQEYVAGIETGEQGPGCLAGRRPPARRRQRRRRRAGIRKSMLALVFVAILRLWCAAC